MYAPLHAPEAHNQLGPRQVWDSFTSALGNVFGVDDEEETSTSTSVITRTVTTAGTPTPTPAKATAITTAEPKTITTTIRATPTPTPEPEPTTVPAFAIETEDANTLPTAIVLPSDATTISESTLALAPPITTSSSSSLAPIDKAFGSGTSTGSHPSQTAQPEESNGNSSAAKAGIVIGVLAGILAIFVLAWLLYNRRRKQMEQRKLEAEDEKINGPINPFADSAAIRTPTTAPRLSLGRVSQFLPNLTTTLPDRRTSRGANMMLSTHAEEPQEPQSPLQPRARPSAWERPTVSSTSNINANPFGDAQRIPDDQSRPISPPSPIQGQAALTTSGSPPRPVSPLDGSEAAIAGAATGAVAGAGLIRKASIRKDLPRPLDLTMPPPMSAVPPSPAGTEFSVNSVAPGQPLGPSASAAAIAAAGGPSQSTVHRVTMDFKPTLEDEMGLVAGQLVRLLHEYDDGWALCIRLDRSQQGVVPRTCLSTRPVKPRFPPGGGPRGPPVNPNRPYGPPGPGPNMRGPHGPGGRPMSPYGPPNSPGGRMSPGPNGRMSPPGGPHSQSPGPRYGPGPQGGRMSPDARRMSPPQRQQQQQQQQMRGTAPGQAY